MDEIEELMSQGFLLRWGFQLREGFQIEGGFPHSQGFLLEVGKLSQSFLFWLTFPKSRTLQVLALKMAPEHPWTTNKGSLQLSFPCRARKVVSLSLCKLPYFPYVLGPFPYSNTSCFVSYLSLNYVPHPSLVFPDFNFLFPSLIHFPSSKTFPKVLISDFLQGMDFSFLLFCTNFVPYLKFPFLAVQGV